MKNPIREALMNPESWSTEQRSRDPFTAVLSVTVRVPLDPHEDMTPQQAAAEVKAFIADLKAADFAQFELNQIREMLRPVAKALRMSADSYSVSSSVVAALLTRMAQIALQTGDQK